MPSQTIHNREKEQFIKLFEKERIDRFDDRLAVLEVFLRTERHVTLEEIRALLREQGRNYSVGFVHETLALMCRYGFAQTNQFDNGKVRYEHRHLGQHHDHMICTKCKRIIEFEDQAMEKLQAQIAAVHGFHLLQHKMELYGICRHCLDQRRQVLSLDSSRPGERLKITGFTGGAKSKMRLLTMGLRVGDQIEVLTNMHHGQVVIACDFNRLVLGQGLAQKILVAPLDSEDTKT